MNNSVALMLNKTELVITNNHNYSLELVLHGHNVAKIARCIGKAMSLSQSECEVLYDLSLFHDIGKSKLPENILYKSSKLTESEWELIKKHPVYSEDIYFNTVANNKKDAQIIRHHHENFDGSGYPDGLYGDNIPLFSRIIAIADVFDAITNPRSYRPYPILNPLEEIQKEINIKLDGYIYNNYALYVLKTLCDKS